MNCIEACKTGDIKTVKAILTDPGVFSYTLNQGKADGFFYACAGGYMDIVQFIDSVHFSNWNDGLRGACLGGRMSMVQFTISKGANQWNSALSYACESGSLDIVHLLISKGANDWNYALYFACKSGNLDIVNLLISKGANDWNRGLCGSSTGGHFNIVNLMISKGANDWSHALYCTYCAYPNVITGAHIMQFLFLKGAKINELYTWENPKCIISRLLYLGIPVTKFSEIKGYQELSICISESRHSIVRSNVMLSDLLKTVAAFIIV